MVHYGLEIRIKERKKKTLLQHGEFEKHSSRQGINLLFLLRSGTKYFKIFGLYFFVVTSNSAVEGRRLTESTISGSGVKNTSIFHEWQDFLPFARFCPSLQEQELGPHLSLQNRLYDFFKCLPADKYLHKRQDTV